MPPLHQFHTRCPGAIHSWWLCSGQQQSSRAALTQILCLPRPLIIIISRYVYCIHLRFLHFYVNSVILYAKLLLKCMLVHMSIVLNNLTFLGISLTLSLKCSLLLSTLYFFFFPYRGYIKQIIQQIQLIFMSACSDNRHFCRQALGIHL